MGNHVHSRGLVPAIIRPMVTDHTLHGYITRERWRQPYVNCSPMCREATLLAKEAQGSPIAERCSGQMETPHCGAADVAAPPTHKNERTKPHRRSVKHPDQQDPPHQKGWADGCGKYPEKWQCSRNLMAQYEAINGTYNNRRAS